MLSTLPFLYMDCVTSIAVPESYVIQKPLIYVYGHMVLDIKYFFNLLFNFILVFEFLMLRLQNH
jgi:hypothetical protein